MIMLTFMKKHGNIRCPGCGGAMTPVELACQPCGLQVRGQFVDNEFASLADDDLHFLRIFVSTEGRIREMERAHQVRPAPVPVQPEAARPDATTPPPLPTRRPPRCMTLLIRQWVWGQRWAAPPR